MTSARTSVYSVVFTGLLLALGCSDATFDPSSGEQTESQQTTEERGKSPATSAPPPIESAQVDGEPPKLTRECSLSISPKIRRVSQQITVSTPEFCVDDGDRQPVEFIRCPGCQGTECCPTMGDWRCRGGQCRTSFATTRPGFYTILHPPTVTTRRFQVHREDFEKQKGACTQRLESDETGFLCGSGNQPPTCEVNIPKLNFNHCQPSNNTHNVTCTGQDPDGDTINYDGWPAGPGSCGGDTCNWTATESDEGTFKSWTCQISDGNGNSSTCTAGRQVRDQHVLDKIAVAEASSDPSFSSPKPKKGLTVQADTTVYLWGDEAASQCDSYSWSWVRCPCPFGGEAPGLPTCEHGTTDDPSVCPTIDSSTPSSTPSNKYVSFTPPFGDADSDKFGDSFDADNTGPDETKYDYILKLEVTKGGTTDTDKVGIYVKDNPPTAVLKADNDTDFSEDAGSTPSVYPPHCGASDPSCYEWRDQVVDCVRWGPESNHTDYDSHCETHSDDDNDDGVPADYASDTTVKTRNDIYLNASDSDDDETPDPNLKFYFVWEIDTDGNDDPDTPAAPGDIPPWHKPYTPQTNPIPPVYDDQYSEAASELGEDQFFFKPLVGGLYKCKSDEVATPASPDWCTETGFPHSDIPDNLNSEAHAPFYQPKLVVVDEAGHGDPDCLPDCYFNATPCSTADYVADPSATDCNPPDLSAQNAARVLVMVDETARLQSTFDTLYWSSIW